MGILRKIRKENFTTVSNDYLQDEKLSWKAKGIITFLMSLPDDWRVNISHLSKCSKDGRDAVMSALKEIESNGYGRKIKSRAKDGTFDNFDFEVADSMVFEPKSDYPTLDIPILDNPTLQNTNEKLNTKVKGKEPENDSGSLFHQQNPNKTTLFRNSIFGDENGKTVFLSKFNKPDFSGVDLNYYYEAVKDWSDSANKKRTAKGWLATVRNFMRSDNEKKKLKMLVKENVSANQDAIDYLKM